MTKPIQAKDLYSKNIHATTFSILPNHLACKIYKDAIEEDVQLKIHVKRSELSNSGNLLINLTKKEFKVFRDNIDFVNKVLKDVK